MKSLSTIFLQIVLILIGIVVLAVLIRMPLMEGRAKDLDLLRIYLDPFILYGYVASIPFFVALYKAFKLLGYVGEHNAFSLPSIMALKSIRYCFILVGILVVGAGVYVKLFHAKDDDPAGFLAISIVATFACMVVATAMALLEKILQSGMDLKAENEQLKR